MRAVASTARAALTTGQVLFVAVLLGACSRGSDAPVWHQESGYRWRELTVAPGRAGFASVPASRTGVRFQNDVSEAALVKNRILGQGAGVALGDVDGDGRPDIFLARTEGCNALYRNLGDWKFEEVAERAGVGACNRHSSGAAFADVDGDNDLDLLLLATTGPNAVYLNDGKGAFAERRDLGLDTLGRGATTLTMADVDGSGKLALYITNYKAYNVDDTVPPQRRAFNQMVRQTSDGTYEIVPEHQSEYKVVVRPDLGGIRMTQRASPDEFYTSDGRGKFTRESITGDRFTDANGQPVAEPAESFGLGARFADLNGDGSPDLFVANDFEDTDELWFNDGRGHFRLAGWKSLRQMSNSSMGVDVADVNGDGRLDLFETDMLANDPRRLKTQIPTHTAFPKKPADTLQLQQQRNTLFVNRGDGTFGEVGLMAGVAASGWSWGTIFTDVDLDGWQDILIANGHLWDVMDADVQEGLQNRLNDIDWQRTRWQFPPLRLRNVAFRNRGDLTFEDASTSWTFGTDEDISHALAAADLDGDGDQDVVVNRLGQPALLLRTETPAPRLAVSLVGSAPNTRGVGAKVRLIGGATPLQMREVTVGGLYMSHSDYGMTFAMGASKSATLVVDWRDGRRTTIAGVQPNREYEVTATTAAVDTSTITVPRPDSGASSAPALAGGAPLFADVSTQLRGHKHVENDFDDWDRQYLLPDALSQAGPGVSFFDLDRDGREDLIVGTGKGGALGVFRNVRGALSPVASRGPAANLDFTTILGLAEGTGARVLAGVSTWESRTDEERIAQPAVVGLRATPGGLGAIEPVVPSHESATGPTSLGDYDGDGRLDLFVGARALPMGYPQPVSSGLFRNVGGRFAIDTANSMLLRDIGMVSASMFLDLTGDGHPELLLAREWGSIALFINDGSGSYSPAPASWGLGAWTSRWNGLAAGDVNGDGQMDLVATSWGRNITARTDSANPLTLVYGPFGARGEVEMLMGRHDARVGGIAPFNSFARARLAVPSILQQVNSFGAYADASVERLLGASNSTKRLQARTLDHTLFINRGNRFEVVSLPSESQWAPAFYAGIADFDGDGAEDLFLAQNFSPTSVGEPRYDAGRSLLMRGDGHGVFTAMTGASSGIVVYGDARGAAYSDFNGDGRLDLAVSQNGAATRLFENRGGKPGLRVRLVGAGTNPDAVGAQVRIAYGEKLGPLREIQAGSGYWSQNGAVQVFGLSATPTQVWVRWPGGAETRIDVPPAAKEVTVRQ